MKARLIPDSERTARLYDALRVNCPPSAVLLCEVPAATGFARGFSDALKLELWPSSKYRLTGYEVKASAADLRRELSAPLKNHNVRQYCDLWYLVVWDEKVISGLEIPVEWGILIGSDLAIHRKASVLAPDEWPKGFVAALVRRAYEHSPAAAFVARACDEAARLARHDAERAARLQERARLRELLGPIIEKVCDTSYLSEREDIERAIGYLMSARSGEPE